MKRDNLPPKRVPSVLFDIPWRFVKRDGSALPKRVPCLLLDFLTAFDHMLEPGGVMRFYARSSPNHANLLVFPDPNEITKLVSKACVNDTKYLGSLGIWRYHSIVCCIVYSWWPINLILTWQVSCRNWWSQLLCSMPMVLLTLATKAEDIKFSLSFIAMLSSLPLTHAGHIYTLYVNYARITVVIIGTSLSLLSPIFSIIVVLYIRRYMFCT